MNALFTFCTCVPAKLLCLFSLMSATCQAAQLSNLSSRALVGGGDEVMISGMVVEGGASKPVLVRAIGPTLAGFGLPTALPDPRLSLVRMQDGTPVTLASNDDWDASLASVMKAVGAFDLPAGSKDAALLQSLPEGRYTPVVSEVTGKSGLALLELYDVDSSKARLVNISTRAKVGAGIDMLIAGLVVEGTGSIRVLFRAVGPGLAPFGVQGLLADPQLFLKNALGVTLASNDNWPSEDPAMKAAFDQVGAFGLPSDSKDSSLVVELPPGAYTIQVSGQANGTGVALAEVYELGSSSMLAPTAVTGVAIDQETLGLSEGRSGLLRAAVLPATATDQSLIWSSSAPEIATVRADGTVLALKAGSAVISATSPSSGKSAICAVSVTGNTQAARLVVLADQPIYATRGGIGSNVTAISSSIAVDQFGGKLGSAYCKLPPASDTAHWDSICHYLSWSGLDWVRLLIEMNDFKPNPEGFTWDSYNVRIACRLLDWAQANKVDVLLQMQGHATTWNTIPGQHPAYSAPRDLDAFAEAFASMVDYLVRTRGYTCIKMVNIANEPMNHWGWWRGGDIKDGYRVTRAALDAKGIVLPLAGTEYFQDNNFNFNWEACRPWLGVYENHNYADASQDKIAFRPISDPAYPVYWGEFGGADNTNYVWDLSTAKWQIGGFSNGIDGYARWSFLNQNDIDGDFSYIRTWDTVNKRLLDTYSITPNLFLIQAMLSRFSSKYSWVHAVQSSSNLLTPAFLRSPDGNLTLIVVNQDTQSRNLSVRLQGLASGRRLYRYALTPADKNRTDLFFEPGFAFDVTAGDAVFQDTVSSQGITVYSTYVLSKNDAGVIDAGAFAPLPAPAAISSHKGVLDDRQLEFSPEWIKEADAADHLGTTTYSETTGAWYSFSFEGSSFTLYGHKDQGSGLGSVYVDGTWAGYCSNYAPLRVSQSVLFQSAPLSPGRHIVKVVNEGLRTLTSQRGYLNVDAVTWD